MGRNTPVRVTCFAGAMQGRQAAGNTADVYLGGSKPAATDSDGTTCVWVQAGESGWEVESFNATGRPIRFCGHGALAAAAVIARADAGWRLPYSSASMQWHAIGVSGSAAEVDVTLKFARPVVELCSVPAFAAASGVAQISAAALLGGDDDYLILEADSIADVETAAPDFEKLAAATKRAACLTASTENGFVFRYFAPQYGQPEDSATGSAAVQLASFWAVRTNRTSFAAEQLSAAGGCMQLACNTDTVELTGRVAYG